MQNFIRAYFPDNSCSNYSINIRPDKCPRCHMRIEPIYRVAYYSSDWNDVEVVWRCPSNNCSRLFISHYKDGVYKNPAPFYPEKPILDESISKISNRFSDVYTQTLAAKAYNLPEIFGMGLRKALEILIKDFCISKNTSEIEKIKSMSLNDCINKYCDGHVRSCAHKSRVLGNDETHYDKKYEDMDINDLERLIKATLHWIGAELIANSYNEIKL